MRALLVKFRTMQVNQVRGLLYEFGATFRAGRVAGLAEIRARMAELEDALPEAMIGSLQDQLQRIDGLEQDIDRLEQRMGTWQKQEAACRAITAVPGIGKLISGVRSSLKPWRIRCHARHACCSTLFAATKRMLGWRTAVNTASASLRSFFAALLLRNGLTNSAAIRCGVWPWLVSQRAQWCAAPQASSPNTHGGSCTAQANASRRNIRVNTIFPDRSAPHTAITSFARSTPTVVISFMTSPLVQIDGHTSILALRCRAVQPLRVGEVPSIP
jgi:hypothetical protein